MNFIKYLAFCLLFILPATELLASIPLGAGRKTATGTVDMYGCLQANDYYIVNFAAYPVVDSKNKKPMVAAECVNIAATGEAVIALDLLDRDVRHKKIALKIIDSNGKTIKESPFDIAKQGVASTQVNFTQAGNFEAVLYIEDDDLRVNTNLSALHIPVTVAMPWNEPAARNTLSGFFMLLLLIIVVLAVAVPRLLKTEKAA